MQVDFEMVPVSDAKARLHELVGQAGSRPSLLFKHSRPTAVIVSYDRWLAALREIEDLRDRLAVHRAHETRGDLRLSHDKVVSELGLQDDA